MLYFDRNRGRRVVVAVVTALLAFACHCAMAQRSPFLPSIDRPGLTNDDMERMDAAAARLYQGRSIGTVERWRSPVSKNAGEVKLVRSFDTHGMPCRIIDYTIRFEVMRDSPDHYVITWCRVENNVWKVVEVPPPP